MEQQKKWNISAFESVAEGIDSYIEKTMGNAHGTKGVVCSAAFLMFLTASEADRRMFLKIINNARIDGLDGSILASALDEVRKSHAAIAADHAASAERIGEQASSKPKRKRQNNGANKN